MELYPNIPKRAVSEGSSSGSGKSSNLSSTFASGVNASNGRHRQGYRRTKSSRASTGAIGQAHHPEFDVARRASEPFFAPGTSTATQPPGAQQLELMIKRLGSVLKEETKVPKRHVSVEAERRKSARVGEARIRQKEVGRGLKDKTNQSSRRIKTIEEAEPSKPDTIMGDAELDPASCSQNVDMDSRSTSSKDPPNLLDNLMLPPSVPITTMSSQLPPDLYEEPTTRRRNNTTTSLSTKNVPVPLPTQAPTFTSNLIFSQQFGTSKPRSLGMRAGGGTSAPRAFKTPFKAPLLPPSKGTRSLHDDTMPGVQQTVAPPRPIKVESKPIPEVVDADVSMSSHGGDSSFEYDLEELDKIMGKYEWWSICVLYSYSPNFTTLRVAHICALSSYGLSIAQNHTVLMISTNINYLNYHGKSASKCMGKSCMELVSDILPSRHRIYEGRYVAWVQIFKCVFFCLLFLTSGIITTLSVDKQYRKVNNVEIWDGSFKSGWERPRKGHNQVTPSIMTVEYTCGMDRAVAHI